ncbi:hypothetical protein FRC07_014930, partial [Ceratobasidium sp. 392]
MAGALDLLLYGIAIFISPVAVYFKKGAGVQFWVNCCLYCLLGVPGMIHAFYIIHTNKRNKRSRRQPQQSPQSPVTQQRYSELPSLPHPDRYRPPASYSPYEDHPPPVPPKREDTLPYDPTLHPNAQGASIGRAKAVLHTYQIPETTLRPPPESERRRRPIALLDTPIIGPTPAPGPEPEPEPVLIPEPEPEALLRPPAQLQTQSEPPPPAPALDPNDPNAPLPYPAGYHPNPSGKNIANAKAVLHTYQIPETTFPAPESEPNLTTAAAEQDKPKRPQPAETSTTGLKSKSMWSLRGKGKGISTLDINSSAVIPGPSSPTPSRPKWHTGPSWLRRRRDLGQNQTNPTTTDEEDGPGTMTMVWDDKFDRLRPPNKSLGRAGGASGHARPPSESMELPFPMPPGSVRPVVDRTGTSNTILRRPGGGRSESGLGAVVEETPQPEEVMSEGEGASNAKKPRWDEGVKPDPSTDTETTRPQRRLMSRLSRRVRPKVNTIGDTPAPDSAPSVVPTSTQSPTSTLSPPKLVSPNRHRSISSPLSRHIAPPAIVASSVNEPRSTIGILRSPLTNNSSSPTSPIRSEADFTMAEFGLGRAGDAYSAGSRALRSSSRDKEKERRPSLSTTQSPLRSPKRLSSGTATSPTSETFSGVGSTFVPLIRRGLTQGTFGTGVTSTSGTSEEGPAAEGGSPGRAESKSEEHTRNEEELSQDEQVERWIKREDERHSQSQSQSQSPSAISHGHSSSEVHHAAGPGTYSLFSEESGFAGLGVGSAQEKGRTGRFEVWDRPDWDGSDPSAGAGASPQGSAQQQHAHYHAEDPFVNPAPSTATHSSYATGLESLPSQPLSPPTSPRPDRPSRAPPAIPQTPVPPKPATLRMDTFGAGERSSFGLLSPPATERIKGKGKERAASPPPPVPARPGSLVRPQSPKLPPKPAILRSMSGGDEDDLSVV